MSIADTKRETSSSSWRRIIRPNVAVGSHVTDIKLGDEVFGGRTGAFAEYVYVRKAIALKPANLTFEQAAAVPTAAITARQGLRDHGASGGVGTFAVQIAKAFGAEVTGVCGPKNVAMVRSLGADHVVDYSREDFTRSGRRYDLLLDIAGSRSWSECQRVLTPQATFVIIGGPKTNRWIGPLSRVLKVRLASMRASRRRKHSHPGHRRQRSRCTPHQHRPHQPHHRPPGIK